jgi:hypothetical protein
MIFLAFLIFSLIMDLAQPQELPAASDWTEVMAVQIKRRFHTATLLSDGQVLFAGGEYNGDFKAITEIYNPWKDRHTFMADLNTARSNHTATLLPDGRVLAVGGKNGVTFLATTEIYDPIADTWTFVASLNTARSNQTATLLPDGRVLVAGGANSGSFPAGAEIYAMIRSPIAGPRRPT